MRDVTINDLAPLARLGLWALSHLRGVYAGDIDAFALQDQAATLGVIVRVPAPKPCGEHCVCAEADADYCYIDTPATVAARRGLEAAANAPVRMWLDDVRPPHEHGRIGWTWVKTADEAIALLATGTVVEASLDHDLDASATLGNTPTERTGYDVVCWMERTNIWPRDGVHVHSMNPSGAARMRAAIRRAEVLR